MKKLLTPICLLLTLSLCAQMTTDDVNLIQAMYGKDKRDVMMAYMKLPDTAASTASFWKLYDSYEAERKGLGQQYLAIIQDYATHYTSLTNTTADQLVARMTANNMAYEKLYGKYYAKIKPVVGALKASQFLQLEGYFRSVIKVAIYDQVPFIGEIDRSKKPNP
jgi:hypothetical protein